MSVSKSGILFALIGLIIAFSVLALHIYADSGKNAPNKDLIEAESKLILPSGY